MTANEKIRWLESLPGETISPKELAAVAGGSPYSYNMAAKNGTLDLPHLWRGRNLRIWKGPVIRLIGGQDVQAVSDDQWEEDQGENDRRRKAYMDFLQRWPDGRWDRPFLNALDGNLKGGSE